MLKNRQDLIDARNQAKAKMEQEKFRILICAGTGCLAGGSGKIYERMQELVAENPDVEIEFGPEIAHGPETEHHHDNVSVKKSGCPGFCQWGPLVRIEPQGVLYTKVKVEDCEDILEQSILNNEVVIILIF